MSSYAVDDGVRLLLFDPLSVPDEVLDLAADREPVVVLTAPWHERDTTSLVERLGAPVFAPPPDTADDLVQMFGITPEQARDGSPPSRGCWRGVASPTSTRRATGFRTASTPSWAGSTTTSCSGSNASER